MRKKKIKAKNKTKVGGRRKTTSIKKVPAKRMKEKRPVAALAAKALPVAVAAADDPVGACSWVDASGQNHCKVTTQSLCKNIPGSTFDAGKQCI